MLNIENVKFATNRYFFHSSTNTIYSSDSPLSQIFYLLSLALYTITTALYIITASLVAKAKAINQ